MVSAREEEARISSPMETVIWVEQDQCARVEDMGW